MPSFALRDHDGSLVRSSDLIGRGIVLSFLDTKCEEACPIIAGEVASAWRRLSKQEQREVVAVAISTDPRDDSPASIRAFAGLDVTTQAEDSLGSSVAVHRVRAHGDHHPDHRAHHQQRRTRLRG